MIRELTLNKEPYTMSESDLPCLVTYGENMGGSHLSMVLATNLFLTGSKILFFTAYPMARENFLEQIGTDCLDVAFINSTSELEKALHARAIFLKSGDESLFLEVIKIIPDLKERVILIKNMEIFSETVLDISLSLDKVILSGNIDTTITKEKIIKKNFKTIIAFNQPNTQPSVTIPKLEKYEAFLSNSIKSGILKIKNS